MTAYVCETHSRTFDYNTVGLACHQLPRYCPSWWPDAKACDIHEAVSDLSPIRGLKHLMDHGHVTVMGDEILPLVTHLVTDCQSFAVKYMGVGALRYVSLPDHPEEQLRQTQHPRFRREKGGR